jgi:hypothetical protein
MIAVDTSTWIAYLQGEEALDTGLLDQALAERQVLMVPAVLTELMSDPKLGVDVRELLEQIPPIDLLAGYWIRAGLLRAMVLKKKRKARLGDALIAQCCLDRQIPLLTRDEDFKNFVEAAGLQLSI